ncbi:unnamed protein product [Effrenium voratum]|nr:unnamed protein product [Effrenium voratum]
MCSLRNIILGMQYVVLQACAEAECDSLFDTKVQQNVGAHLHVESLVDDIADQLYRSMGKAHCAFLEYVSSCDPTRSVHYTQMSLSPPQVQPNDQLAMALDTVFVANFLRQHPRDQKCNLQELCNDLDALGIPLPELPALRGARNLRAWALAKTKPSPESRERGLGEDNNFIVNVPQNPSSQPGGAPEPISFGNTGRKPGVSPSNATVLYTEKPQLSPLVVDAAVHVIQHHFTFPDGIRARLHRLLFEEYGLTLEQAQTVEIARTTNIDGKRLAEDVLFNIDQKEKARLRKYFVDTGKDVSHLLAPALVPAPWSQGMLAKRGLQGGAQGRVDFLPCSSQAA